jgi:hypothetical protein
VGSQFKEFLKHGHRIYNIGILCRENQTKCMPLTEAYLYKAGHKAQGRMPVTIIVAVCTVKLLIKDTTDSIKTPPYFCVPSTLS